MNVVTFIVAVAIVLTGIIYSRINRDVINFPQENKEEVLSESDDGTNSDNNSEHVDVDVTPTSIPSATSLPTPTQPVPESNILNYKYPNSQLISTFSNTLSLESEDDSDVITNWYKQMLNSLGMNVKTFVTTKANDKVLNKLVVADGNKEISVEISKESMNLLVNISVTIISR